MPKQSPEHYLMQQLREKQPFTEIKDALKIFAESRDTSDLTIGGEILQMFSSASSHVKTEILWIEPELDSIDITPDAKPPAAALSARSTTGVADLANSLGNGCGLCSGIDSQDGESIDPKQTLKSTRMWPFAPAAALQSDVDKLHEEFLLRPGSHYQLTKKWLKPSIIIDNEELRSSIPNFPQIVLVLLDDVEINAFKTWDWYEMGQVALIKRQDTKPKLYVSGYEENDLCASLRTQNKCFNLFYQWLVSVRNLNRFEGFGVYGGFEIGTRAKVRLWAGFTKNVQSSTLVTVSSFYDRFQAQYAQRIQESVGHGPLQVLWNKTATKDVHKPEDKDVVLGHLKTFIHWEEQTWPGNFTEETVVEAVKGICGVPSRIRGGEHQLTVVGAFFILLAAIADKRGRKNTPEDVAKVGLIDNGSQLLTNILPYQEPVVAQRCLELLYDIFIELAEPKNKETTSTDGFLQAKLASDAFELRVQFDPLAISNPGDASSSLFTRLSAALGRFFEGGLRNVSSQPPDALSKSLPKGACGKLSSNIAELSQLLSIISEPQPKAHNLLFPQSVLEVRRECNGSATATILRFNVCKTS